MLHRDGEVEKNLTARGATCFVGGMRPATARATAPSCRIAPQPDLKIHTDTPHLISEISEKSCQLANVEFTEIETD
jgi:hypothetical protein